MACRYLRVNAAAVALTLSAISSSGTAQAGDSTGLRVQIPDSIGAYRMTYRKDFPPPSGSMFRYVRADSLSADVFLYRGPGFDARCDSACAHRVLVEEGDGFVGSISEFIRRGYVDTMIVLDDRYLVPDSVARWRIGRHLRFEQLEDGVRQRSDLYLFYVPGYRIKIRATYAADSANVADISRFAELVPLELARPRPPATAEGDSTRRP